MPRTVLASQFADASRLKKEIEKRLIDLDKNKTWLSIQSNIGERTLRNKLNNGGFYYDELFSIFKVLEMPQETILILFGR